MNKEKRLYQSDQIGVFYPIKKILGKWLPPIEKEQNRRAGILTKNEYRKPLM